MLRNVVKYEGLQDLAQLPRMLYLRSSENPQNTNFAFTEFYEVHLEKGSKKAADRAARPLTRSVRLHFFR